jgi:hypothetical protein
MKFIALVGLLAFSATATRFQQTGGDRTITKVVKLLQNMLDKSKAEGDSERTLYGKFKCYCDQNEAEKNDSIKQLSEQIAVLESKIAEIQGSTGSLSSDVAKLKADMAANKAAQQEANALRGKEKSAFDAEEADLEQAIDQMHEAIEVLSSVGADQTMSSGADNAKFMAGTKFNLLSVQSQVQNALKAASALMDAKQRHTANAFIQAPFTGSYTSQSAEVLGILKEMRDTFKTNLADARTTEENAIKVHGKFIEIKTAEFDKMKKSYGEKQGLLADNDSELGAKKQALSEAEKNKASDEEFLSQLLPMCADKTKEYDNRKLLRANEEAAISEAISILNSDAAFETFGTTDATSTGAAQASFLQMRSTRRHVTADSHARSLAKKVLEKAEKKTTSKRIGKVIALLQTSNPFTDVLGEIANMITLIGEEAKADKDNLDWCNKERDENDNSLAQKKSDIISLTETINTKTSDIEDPETGLKKLIEGEEMSLVQNKESQAEQTKERTENNVNYQADIRNLVDAQTILSKALNVLKTYYTALEKKLAAETELVQEKEDPAAPDATLNNKGQSEKGGDVIELLKFILDETNKEEMEAHKAEESAQATYEDEMTALKKKEAKSEASLVTMRETLAETEKDLLAAQEDLKKTTADEAAIEAYLLKIKPGCDFITTNFAKREENRATEKTALEKAVTLIKDTPAYKTAMANAHQASLGECKDKCSDEAHAKCKACLAGVTIPAYCAGHKDTTGC